MSRKLLAILSALLIAASLCACGDTEEDTTDGNKIEITDKETDTSDEETNESGETGSQVTPPVVDTKNPGDFTYSEKNDKIYVLGSNLNLRTADYEIYDSVTEGTELKRTGISTDANGKWSRIEFDGKTLYVANEYITLLADLDAGFTPVDKTLVAAKSLKCHIAPEEDAEWQQDVKIVKWFVAGDQIKVVMENAEAGWYKVEFTTKDGEGNAISKYGYVYSTVTNFETEEETTADVTEAPNEETTEAVTDATEETTSETPTETSTEAEAK